MRALFAYAAALALSGPSMTLPTNTTATGGTPTTVLWDALAHWRRCLERDLAQSVDRLLDDGAYRRRVNGTDAGHDDPTALNVHYDVNDDDDDAFEGRGKKKKDKKNKMGMMMGAAAMGMSVIGGMAMKMMMGGVAMIAVKALVIAKIALLLASIIALKKLLAGGGGGGGGMSGPVWSSSGGGSESGGYRRSYGLQTDDAAEPEMSAASAVMAYKDQMAGNGYTRRSPVSLR